MVVLCTGAEGATLITGYSPALHDRFDSASFIGDAFDWSGIGRSSDSSPRWATMINSQYFLSANHYFPSNNSSITFHLDNNSVGPTVVGTVESSVRIGDTDLRLGKLTTPLPSSVKAYSIATGTFWDEMVYQAGLRGTQGTPGTTNFVVGLNNVEAASNLTISGLGTNVFLGYVRDISGDIHFHNPGETFLQAGDSGAPTFVVREGELALLGIHSFIQTALSEDDPDFSAFFQNMSPNNPYQSPGIQTRDSSFDVWVTQYANDIIIAIPEIGTVWMLGIMGMGLLGAGLVRKRR